MAADHIVLVGTLLTRQKTEVSPALSLIMFAVRED